MPGCAGLVILLALVAYVVAQGASVDGLPAGFVVGLLIGAALGLLGVFDLGWNAHVDHVEERDTARARENAQRDRR